MDRILSLYVLDPFGPRSVLFIPRGKSRRHERVGPRALTIRPKAEYNTLKTRCRGTTCLWSERLTKLVSLVQRWKSISHAEDFGTFVGIAGEELLLMV